MALSFDAFFAVEIRRPMNMVSLLKSLPAHEGTALDDQLSTAV